MRGKTSKPPLAIVGSSSATGPEPPRKLGESGLALWRAIQAEFRIHDVGGVELLLQACSMQDRVAAMAARIDADGEVVHTKVGPKEHPLLRSELQGRSFIVRTLGRLGVTDEILKPVGRPPVGGIGWRGWDAE
jgi:hypothetical protein